MQSNHTHRIRQEFVAAEEFMNIGFRTVTSEYKFLSLIVYYFILSVPLKKSLSRWKRQNRKIIRANLELKWLQCCGSSPLQERVYYWWLAEDLHMQSPVDMFPQSKLDGEALLVTDPPCANSITRQNPRIYNSPLFIVIFFEPIMPF